MEKGVGGGWREDWDGSWGEGLQEHDENVCTYTWLVSCGWHNGCGGTQTALVQEAIGYRYFQRLVWKPNWTKSGHSIPSQQGQ